MTPTQKCKADALRSDRRKRRRENVPEVRDPSNQVLSGSSGNTSTFPDPYEVQVMPPCTFCGAKRFLYEPPYFCCSASKVVLAPVKMPQELQSLYESKDGESEEFLTHIRAYNSIFSFTSFGVNIDKQLSSSRKGVYTFKVHGQAYHELPSLLPGDTGPCYFHLYFVDTDNEVSNRLNKIPGTNLSESLVERIMSMLSINPYAKVLHRLKDTPLDACELRIRSDAQLDQRVYNCPSANDVAAVWVEGNNSTIPLERDIVVTAHSGSRHRVHHYFGCYDPL